MLSIYDINKFINLKVLSIVRAANYFNGLVRQIVKIEPGQEDIGRTTIIKLFNY